MLRDLRRLAGESLIYGLSGMISRFLSFFLVPVYARVFSPAEFGVMSLIFVTVSLVSVFVVLALDNSAHRWYWDTEDTADRKVTFSTWTWCYLLVASMAGGALFLMAGSLASVIVGSRDATYLFQLAAATVPVTVLGQVLINWLRVQRRAWAAVSYAIGTSVMTIVATIVLVVGLHRGIAGVFQAQIIAGAAGSLASLLLMRDWVMPSWFRWRRLREMMRYALPLIPAALAYWVVNLSDRYFVNVFATTRDVGLYQAANAIAALLFLGTSAFQMAWGPFAMSIHKKAHAKDVYANTLLGYTWLTCLAASGISILAPEAIRVVATPRYLGAASAVPTLAFSYVMIGGGYIAGLGPLIAKTTRPVAASVALAAGVNVVLNVTLIPWLGIVGAGISTFVSFGVMTAYLFVRSQALYRIPYRFTAALGLLAYSLAFSMVMERWRPHALWLGISGKLSLLTLFVPIAFLFRIVTPEQAKRLIHRSSALPTAG